MPLTGKQTRHLRSLGHHLEPVVQIGKNGITEALVAQLGEALARHELIKVKLLPESPVDRHEAGEELASAAGAELVQTLGKTLLLWKRNPQAARIELPKQGGKKPKKEQPSEPVKERAPAPVDAAEPEEEEAPARPARPAIPPRARSAEKRPYNRDRRVDDRTVSRGERRPVRREGQSEDRRPARREGQSEDRRPARREGQSEDRRPVARREGQSEDRRPVARREGQSEGKRPFRREGQSGDKRFSRETAPGKKAPASRDRAPARTSPRRGPSRSS